MFNFSGGSPLATLKEGSTTKTVYLLPDPTKKKLLLSITKRKKRITKADRRKFKKALSNFKTFDKLETEKGEFFPLADPDTIEKIYVSGPSGVGKSTFLSNWIKNSKKLLKGENEVLVFSSVDRDNAIDRLDPVRYDLDELVDDPLPPEELENSITIFDDTDTIQNNTVKQAVAALRDYLLEQGRHYRVRMLITSHLLTNYSHTRRILNEATGVVIFPKGGGTYFQKRFLTTYAGLAPIEIKKILDLPSRWVYIKKTYPMLVIYEKGIFPIV